MNKSILLLSLVAILALWSGGSKNTKGNEGEQDSLKNTECRKNCESNQDFDNQWAKFDSLTTEEQQQLLAKRSECFAECKAKKEEKKGYCNGHKEGCENKSEEEKAACEAKKAELKKRIDSLYSEWSKYESMTIAEKKAFFDKLDKLMPYQNKGKKACNKQEVKEKACCKK
ncbi:MAG: hypothetical protein Q4A56_05080 [Porphyromonadaceae bacterium]|nr:hypothetical protein [Porphyromonadaceae bacterium]